METTTRIKQVIRHYYKTSRTLELPENPQWRQFRVKKLDGHFVKIQNAIKTLDDLKRELDRFRGDISDVYYTTSKWLNQEKVGSKQPKGHFPIMLGADLIFDIDSDGTLEGLEEARKQTKKLFTWLNDRRRSLEITDIRFSGKKGFHIIAKQAHLKLPDDYRERIAFLERKRKLYISQFPKQLQELNK